MEALNSITNHPVINRHGPKIALAGSIIFLLIFLITSGFSIRTQAKTKAENYKPQPVQAVSNRNNRPRYRINDVVSANLFGNPAPATKKIVQNAPKTTLDLKLQGILSATDNSVARAIISSSKNKKAELYSVGENIKGAGASVKEIRAQEVILNRNGAVESLPLEKLNSKGDNSIYTPIDRSANNTKNKPVANPRNGSAQSRKIRKPNLSGLDQALDGV